jgi:hypothetical protein
MLLVFPCKVPLKFRAAETRTKYWDIPDITGKLSRCQLDRNRTSCMYWWQTVGQYFRVVLTTHCQHSRGFTDGRLSKLSGFYWRHTVNFLGVVLTTGCRYSRGYSDVSMSGTYWRSLIMFSMYRQTLRIFGMYRQTLRMFGMYRQTLRMFGMCWGWAWERSLSYKMSLSVTTIGYVRNIPSLHSPPTPTLSFR